MWATKISMWWPKRHSVSGDPDLTVTIEPRQGGRIYERSGDGAEHDWGRVTEWAPPRRLAYLWHIAWDPAEATQVEITFTPAGAEGTRVGIVHRGWERFGADAPAMRDRNRAGWSALIVPFSSACAS